MKRALLIGGGALVALLIAFASGRASVRAKTTTITRVVEVEKRVEVAAKVADTAKVVATDQGVQWRERIVYRKGGTTVVTREVVRENKATTTDSTHAAETHATTTEHTAAKETLRIVEPPRLAQWSVGAFAGMGLDGGRHAGSEVSRRLFGPVWIGVHVDVTARAGMLAARIEF